MIQVVVALSGRYDVPAPPAPTRPLALSGTLHGVDLHSAESRQRWATCRGPILGCLCTRSVALAPRLRCRPTMHQPRCSSWLS